jgi:hypothetical protein
MQSDVLPFTLYDTLSYAPVGMVDIPPDEQPQQGQGQGQKAPQGFERRDSPQLQQRGAEPPPMPPPPDMSQDARLKNAPPQGATGGGGGYAVEQGPQEDIQLAFEDFGNGGAKGQDIGNYKKTSDLWYIIIAVLAIDVLVIALCRFLPEVFGSSLNRWYDLFSLNAVIADVLIIFIGFLIARYVWTGYAKEKFSDGKWSPLKFTGLSVAVQLVHDVLFYFGVITQVPRGQNAMMDVFKDYAASGGAKILFGDALMMVGSSVLAIGLKSQPWHIVASFASVVGYALPYLLYTRNQYSSR